MGRGARRHVGIEASDDDVEEDRVSLRLARDSRIPPDVEKVREALLRFCDRIMRGR